MLSEIWTGLHPDFRHFWILDIHISDTDCTFKLSKTEDWINQTGLGPVTHYAVLFRFRVFFSIITLASKFLQKITNFVKGLNIINCEAVVKSLPAPRFETLSVEKFDISYSHLFFLSCIPLTPYPSMMGASMCIVSSYLAFTLGWYSIPTTPPQVEST